MLLQILEKSIRGDQQVILGRAMLLQESTRLANVLSSLCPFWKPLTSLKIHGKCFLQERPEPFPLPSESPIMQAAAGWAHCVVVTGVLFCMACMQHQEKSLIS